MFVLNRSAAKIVGSRIEWGATMNQTTLFQPWKKYHLPIWSALLLTPMLCLFQGCSTTQTARSEKTAESNVNLSALHRPLSSKEITQTAPLSGGNFPLGITGRFDLFVSDTAEQVAEVYDTVIRPIQKGKLFQRQPYEIDYAILPERGDVFKHDGRLGSPSIESNYEFRLGMVRQFSNFSDFLTTDFWMAKGQYGPKAPKRHHSSLPTNGHLLDPSGAGSTIDLETPYIDPQAVLGTGWNDPRK